jgi:uncharacterized membrane protein YdjX (TVP38/TMEM64 family)/rhodanese-related sulfurtransferase
MNVRRLIPRLLVLLALVAAAAWTVLHRDQINLASLEAGVRSLGFWAPAAYVSLFAAATLAFVPGLVFALVGGALFGPVWGTLWNLLGATIGSSLAFLIARYLAGDLVTRKAGGLLGRLIEGVDAEGWRFVAFVRLVPLFPFNLSNYALGLTRIPFLQYVVASVICMVPGAIAYTWLGHAGREALAGEAAAVRYGLLGLGLIAATAVLPRFIARLRARVSWIDAGDLKHRLDAGETLRIVDVRGPDEFVSPLGHIVGARNIPVAELNARLPELAGLDPAPVVLVCLTDKRSSAAAATLSAAGFKQVSVLRRGMTSWNESGFPIARNAA